MILAILEAPTVSKICNKPMLQSTALAITAILEPARFRVVAYLEPYCRKQVPEDPVDHSLSV